MIKALDKIKNFKKDDNSFLESSNLTEGQIIEIKIKLNNANGITFEEKKKFGIKKFFQKRSLTKRKSIGSEGGRNIFGQVFVLIKY